MKEKPYQGLVPFITWTSVPPRTRWQGTFPYYLFSLTLNGRIDYQMENQRMIVQPGDFLCFYPYFWQDWEVSVSGGNWDVYYMVVQLPSRLLSILPRDNVVKGLGKYPLSPLFFSKIKQACDEMVEWNIQPFPLANEIFYNQLEYIFLLLRSFQPQEHKDPRIQKVITFIHHTFKTPLTLEMLAQQSCLSRSRFCALFLQTMGVSPMAYVEQVRIEHAMKLLLYTSEPIDQIMEKVGYTDRKYFDKRFKRWTGLTPFMYRRKGKDSLETNKSHS